MDYKNRNGVSESENAAQARPPTVNHLIVPAIDVVREGRPEPFLDSRPTRSSAFSQWGGFALENYTVPAVFMPRHEHPEDFLHVVLSGPSSTRYAQKAELSDLLHVRAQCSFCLGGPWMK